MTQAATKSRIKFLASSAQMFLQVAPATSAHLMLECGNVAASNNMIIKLPDLERVCNSCGTILISGWTSKTSVVNRSRSKRSRLRPRSASLGILNAKNKIIATQCLACHRFTSSQLEHVARHASVRKKDTMSQAAHLMTAASTPPVTGSSSDAVQDPRQKPLPANTASRKRAKARRQVGLQAMLQKASSAGTEVSSPALGLMDFMKLA